MDKNRWRSLRPLVYLEEERKVNEMNEENTPSATELKSPPPASSNSHSENIRELNELIQKESAFLDLLLNELSRSIIGQKDMLEKLVI